MVGNDTLESVERRRTLGRIALVTLAISIAFGVWAHVASAASTYVPNTGTPSADGTALSLAIGNAAAGDVIYLGPGTYAPSQSLDLTKNVTIVGLSSGQTVIDGGNLQTPSTVSGNLDLIVAGLPIGSSGTEPTVALRNLKLTGTGTNGNALDVFGATTTVDHSLFVNSGTNVGVNSNGTLTLTNSTINGQDRKSVV